MAEGYIDNPIVTVKKYSVTPAYNEALANITHNMFDRMADFTVTNNDISAYGNIISVCATGYGGVPVPVSIFSENRVLAVQWSSFTNDVNIYITFSKKSIHLLS